MRMFRMMGCLAMLVVAAAAGQAAMASVAKAHPLHTAKLAPQTGDTLRHIEKSGTLRVGVAPNAPWVLRDQNGQWIGLDIDLVRQLAQDMHWKVAFVPTTWTAGIDDLRAGRFDVLAAGLSVTPQRALRVKYSRPYGEFALGLVVNSKSLGHDDLLSLESGSGKHRIGVLSGTVTAATAKEYLGNSDLVQINDESQAIKDLRNGKLDGLMAEQPLPTALARAFPDQLRTLDVSTYGQTAHAFAVRRGDADLIDVIDAWLVYEQAAGWIRSREQFWIRSPAWIELM